MTSKTQISRLQLQGARHDTPGLRLALSRLLNDAELLPATVSPSAVLIVRRLADPLPRRINPHGHAVRVDAAWEQAAQNALAGLYHQAARPGQGSVPTNAEAVLFIDEGEMLASLAVDVLQGEALGRWWWRAILRSLPSASSTGLTTLLCSRAMVVPAALHHLAKRGQAIRVIEALSPHQAMAILSAVGRAFGIPDFHLAPTHSSEPSDVQPPNLRPQVHEPASGEDPQRESSSIAHPLRGPSVPATVSFRFTTTTHVATEAPPWSLILVPPHLGKERACLLGVGLSLYEQPSVVRSEAFVRSLHAWWAGSTAPLDDQPVASPAISRPAPLPRQREHAPGLAQTTMDAFDPSLIKLEAEGLQRSGGDETVEPLQDAGHQDTAERDIAQGTPTKSPPREMPWSTAESSHHLLQSTVEALGGESRGHVLRGQSDERPQAAAPNREQKAHAAAQQATALRLAGGVQTEVGGLLYLINLMRHLDLPACFEADWGLDSQVGPWGVLEVLGRSLLTGISAQLGTDPMWEALAQLGGRMPGELPGAAFGGSDRFDLPAHWMVPVRNQEGNVFHWATDRQRLRVWSIQGYLLVDWARDASLPLVQAREALQSYVSDTDSSWEAGSPIRNPFDQAPIDPLTSPLVAGLNPHLARWLALALPYLRFRLQQALTQGSPEEYDLDKALLRYRGRLYVTTTHVDLVMRLDDVSLPLRLAGLDCNPGWLADFGRVVLFHFA